MSKEAKVMKPMASTIYSFIERIYLCWNSDDSEDNVALLYNYSMLTPHTMHFKFHPTSDTKDQYKRHSLKLCHCIRKKIRQIAQLTMVICYATATGIECSPCWQF